MVIASQFRRLQFLRYIGVGLWNTGFGYASFALTTRVLSIPFPKYGYVAAGAVSSVLNITVAFLGYKWVVFKTKGNYLREWWMFLTVYGTSIVFGLLLLPVLVFTIHKTTQAREAAPYLAGALLMAASAIYNYFGNKKLTFRPRVETS